MLLEGTGARLSNAAILVAAPARDSDGPDLALHDDRNAAIDRDGSGEPQQAQAFAHRLPQSPESSSWSDLHASITAYILKPIGGLACL